MVEMKSRLGAQQNRDDFQDKPLDDLIQWFQVAISMETTREPCSTYSSGDIWESKSILKAG